jgi:nucleoside-diphosphate-sugar epimerase
VTGANGFIGRRLVDQLVKRGHHLRILSRQARHLPGVEIYEGTLGEDPPARFTGFVKNVDAVIHCAGEIRDQSRMVKTHVDGTRDLIQACDGQVSRWIQLSSVGAYGPIRSGEVSEETAERPQGTYEESKARSDAIALELAGSRGMAVAVLRPSIVIGDDMPNSSIRQMAGMIRRGIFFYAGKPGASANYVHVDDVVRALVFLTEHNPPATGIFNLSSWSTIEAFATALAETQGTKPPGLRLPESLVRAAAAVGSYLPRFPLTTSRIDALTNRACYPCRRLEALGFQLEYRADAAAAAAARNW